LSSSKLDSSLKISGVVAATGKIDELSSLKTIETPK